MNLKSPLPLSTTKCFLHMVYYNMCVEKSEVFLSHLYKVYKNAVNILCESVFRMEIYPRYETTLLRNVP